MRFLYKLFLIFIFIFSISINVLAAIGPESIPELQEQVTYEVYPAKPKVGDTIDISAQMYGTEVKDSEFAWTINGKAYERGVGINKISFSLIGKTNVVVKIVTGPGVFIEKSFDFDPKNILIIWESKTFTPPFYKGKSLHSPESSVILNALNLGAENPLTNKYNEYVWKVNGTVMGDESGVGRSTYLYQQDILGLEPSIKVTMSGISSYNDRQNGKGSSFVSEAEMSVEKFPTEIISYEKSPSLGVLFNKTVKSEFSLNKDEGTLVAYPLYYSLSSSLAGLYEWYINDVQINTTFNALSFRKKKDNEKSRLTVSIKNKLSILQSKDASFIIDTSR